MADNSRIEDLRKRYHENPRRFFAPLANEYRKSGFLDRALLLCQKHVPEQPENMNGLVVFGQTLFELGQHDAAREPFENALKLDPENLIALRHLGDIARLGGDNATAKQWYEKVLELDRRNDEVLDLIAQMGGGDEPAPASESPSAAAPLISVAPSVSVSGGPDLGMIDLDAPAAAPAAPSAPAKAPTPPAASFGKGSTVVINAQALADRDRQESEAPSASAATLSAEPPSASVAAPSAEAPSAEAPKRPSKRASLLDLDFSELLESPSAKPPVDPGAITLAIEPTAAHSDALTIETSGDVAPLALEPTIMEAPSAPPPLPAGDFELAEFSAQVSPLAGLEATEFSSEQVAPMAELETDSLSLSASTVPPLAGLDRPEMPTGDIAPLAGLDGPGVDVPAESGLADLADLPLLDEPSAASAPLPLLDEPSAPSAPLPLLDEPSVASAPLPLLESPSADASSAESPSARPKPRMTKADLASLPLLADFGLEDDAPAAPAAESAAPEQPEPPLAAPPIIELGSAPSARTSKATPTFVTETMAALYVKQGLFAEAIGVYRQLVEASPSDPTLRAKLAELERMHAQEQAPKAPVADVDMPDFDEPQDMREPEPAPANAAMSGLSFGGIGLKGQGTPTPIVTPAVSGGPTAREFFSNFARRAAIAAAVAASAPAATVASAATPLSAPAIEAEPAATSAAGGWPLDAVFGAASDVRDLHAAEMLAGLGTFEGPDGGTGLSALFAPAEAPQRRSVPRASEMLKFDQFFAKPGTSDPAAAPMPTEGPGDDDLDQFQGWLKGLKQ